LHGFSVVGEQISTSSLSSLSPNELNQSSHGSKFEERTQPGEGCSMWIEAIGIHPLLHSTFSPPSHGSQVLKAMLLQNESQSAPVCYQQTPQNSAISIFGIDTSPSLGGIIASLLYLCIFSLTT
jgi:hypothetical protein